mmetsp:Transcript_47276/g.132018  ORF Transcript_47276/g.132018 Transcript_47276/m.132018 type:complete len:277 (-) Transcript_47276:58-888(-)
MTVSAAMAASVVAPTSATATAPAVSAAAAPAPTRPEAAVTTSDAPSKAPAHKQLQSAENGAMITPLSAERPPQRSILSLWHLMNNTRKRVTMNHACSSRGELRHAKSNGHSTRGGPNSWSVSLTHAYMMAMEKAAFTTRARTHTKLQDDCWSTDGALACRMSSRALGAVRLIEAWSLANMTYAITAAVMASQACSRSDKLFQAAAGSIQSPSGKPHCDTVNMSHAMATAATSKIPPRMLVVDQPPGRRFHMTGPRQTRCSWSAVRMANRTSVAEGF